MDQEWTWIGSGSGPELDNFIDFIDLSDLVIVTQVCFGMKTLKVLRKAFRRLNICLVNIKSTILYVESNESINIRVIQSDSFTRICKYN